MAVKSKSPTTGQMHRALKHPLRRRILRLIDGETKSPRILAAELGESLPSVSYHVRVLCECNVLRLVRTEPVRGSIEHFYKPAIETASAQTALSDRRSKDR